MLTLLPSETWQWTDVNTFRGLQDIFDREGKTRDQIDVNVGRESAGHRKSKLPAGSILLPGKVRRLGRSVHLRRWEESGAERSR